MDENLAKRTAENGRRLVLEKYDWSDIARKMEEIFADLLKKQEEL